MDVAWKETGLFGSLLQCGSGTARVLEPFLDVKLMGHLTSLLPRFIKSRVPALSAPCLTIPHHAGAPLWVAVLRLRPLRDFWDRELRRHHAELLRDLLPDAWLFETVPLPPQAVIPRLELHDWREIEALVSAGKSFGLADPEHVESTHWIGRENGCKASGPVPGQESPTAGSLPPPLVLWEQTPPADPKTLLALYHRSDRRVEMVGLLCLNQVESTWAVSTVRVQ